METLVNCTFGRLTVIGAAGRDKSGIALWLCRCICGKQMTSQKGNLKNGRTKSCGCWKREFAAQRMRKHGTGVKQPRAVEYSTWSSMIARCENPNSPAYKNYGGRGITVCKRWRDSYANFFADMGKRPNGLTIERIDNDKGYSPDNCKWATRAEQARNQRRTYKSLVSNGESLSLTDWASRTGLHSDCISSRLRRGWSVERALTAPRPRRTT